MNTHRDTAPLLWLGLVLAVALAIAFLLPVTPNDYWWYLRLGADTLAGGAVPVVDTFTFTRFGEPVTYHSWGAALLLWLVYKAGGLTLSVLLRGVLVVLTYGSTWRLSRRLGAGRLGAALVVLAAVLATSNNWSLRPQLLAYPLFALSLYILYRWREGHAKGLAWLPLISLLWVNLHGSFVMLVLLTGAGLVFPPGEAGKPRRQARLALAFAGVLLASLLNPRGFGAWTYVVDSLTAPASQGFSAEWLPPVNDHWQMSLFFLWLLIFPLLAHFAPRRLSALEWTWFLGFGFLALWGERYVIWFILLLAPLTARLAADWEARLVGTPKQSRAWLNISLCLVFLLLPLVLLPGVRQAWWADAPPATENTPVEAADWLAEHPDLPGPLWSEIGFSSYLEFALPSRPTWIDTRFEVFPVAQWQDYRHITEAGYAWEQKLDESGAQLLMISTLTQPDLLTALQQDPDWCERFRDATAVIFQRCGGGE